MGFNIGVYPAQANNYPDCRYFIDRAFYDFVNNGESYGDQSILLQSGKYYGLDLSSLLKLVYTWDEVPADYIKENTQFFSPLNLPVVIRVKLHYPFNAVFVSEHSGVGIPGAVANRPFNLSAC